MKLSFQSGARQTKTPLCVAFGFEGKKPELPDGVELPKRFAADFKGEARCVSVTYTTAGAAERVVLIGLGPAKALDAETWRRVAAIAAKQAESLGVAKASLFVGDKALAVLGAEVTGRAVAEGAVMGSYSHTAGKSEAKKPTLGSLEVRGAAGLRKGVARGTILGQANCFTRDLQNEPGNRMTPRHLAAAAKKLAAKSARLSCTVHDEKAMKKMGMGLLLGVAAGSTEPPRLIHLTYKPKGRSKGRIAFVGKGLSFDAGGYSLKPSPKMDEMRYDMSGGAAVLGAFHALASLDLPYEVHGIVPSTENLIDGNATKPGDLHKGMNGTTVEVLNTDAEGRLILADALTYVEEKVKADTIIDLATLTGAVVVALGHEISGMFASSDRLRDTLLAAGQATGEPVWPLPLLEEHKRSMRGVVADIKNIARGDMGAGSSAGAAFLSYFVDPKTEWCHLDIAGAAWGGVARDWVGGPQGSGVGTRLLIQYLETRG